MTVALDLNKCHARREIGDMTLFMTWLRREHDWHPCLVILPAALVGKAGATPCVVPLDNAWRWSPDIGDGAHCARTAFEFCEALRLNPYEPRNLVKVAVMIQDHIGDLLRIPPRPQERNVVAEAFLTDRETGKVGYQEVTEDV